MARKSNAKSTGVMFKTLERGSVQKWEKGKIVEGRFVECREGTSDMFENKGHLLDIRTANGLGTFSCPTVLTNYCKQVEPGDYVRITCLGKIKAARGKAWDFKFEVADSNANDDDDTNDAE